MKKLLRNRFFTLSILYLFVITSMFFIISCGGDDDGGTALDTTPPTPPANLRVVSTSATQITLEWDHSTDNVGVTGYMVFMDGILEATVSYISSYDVTGLSPNTTYCFTVTASDAAGNVSDPSDQLCQTTSDISTDTDPPDTPTGLNVKGSTNQIFLSWNPSAAQDVVGYKVYRDGIFIKFLPIMSTSNRNDSGLAASSAITASALITYTDLGLNAGTFYCYRVTAVDGSGNESGYSPSHCAYTSNPGAEPPPPPCEPNGEVPVIGE
jgi:chitodextrinase